MLTNDSKMPIELAIACISIQKRQNPHFSGIGWKILAFHHRKEKSPKNGACY
jgi:hypothetical protein